MNLEYKKRLDRILELAKKSKELGLTKEEIRERDKLRREYVADFRSSLKIQMDGIKYLYEDEESLVE